MVGLSRTFLKRENVSVFGFPFLLVQQSNFRPGGNFRVAGQRVEGPSVLSETSESPNRLQMASLWVYFVR